MPPERRCACFDGDGLALDRRDADEDELEPEKAFVVIANSFEIQIDVIRRPHDVLCAQSEGARLPIDRHGGKRPVLLMKNEVERVPFERGLWKRSVSVDLREVQKETVTVLIENDVESGCGSVIARCRELTNLLCSEHHAMLHGCSKRRARSLAAARVPRQLHRRSQQARVVVRNVRGVDVSRVGLEGFRISASHDERERDAHA
jgi:hypothetical protein